ncbi:MFS transporter [uncultured Prevotella sp.]|uniref:MFS transporter n=1 Tax=uncultured Prevotella sp. TaxID=159272 RepID=UPI002628E9F8|nr:MFS transporter [uncultured Prevotella sp.]
MNLKVRLSVMNFLEFAVWGAYLTSMGNYLGKAGMGTEIAWFYAIQGIVSIFMPTLMGIVADKWIQPQRLLGLCHLAAGAGMIALCMIGAQQAMPDKAVFMTIYTLSVAFYMPTLALSNTVAFKILQDHGRDTVKDFPPIRVLGTVGFIATMWFVNCATADNGSFSLTLADDANKFQYTYMQFLVSGLLGIVLFVYSFFMLPQCKLVRKKDGAEKKSLMEVFGLNAFKLFKSKKMALFFIFSGLLGMSLQVTNGYATPFITHFKADPALADTFAANNATLLVSISQIAEAFCILLIPFFLKRYGIKNVMMIAMFAWVLRFGFFGLGGPAFPGVTLFILSCLVYGVAFDFFNVSGGLFVDAACSEDVKASAQGLFMLMTNGLGATIGTLLAGEIVNHYCTWENGFLVGDWQTCWFIFAGFALAVGVSFALLFKHEEK